MCVTKIRKERTRNCTNVSANKESSVSFIFCPNNGLFIIVLCFECHYEKSCKSKKSSQNLENINSLFVQHPD